MTTATLPAPPATLPASTGRITYELAQRGTVRLCRWDVDPHELDQVVTALRTGTLTQWTIAVTVNPDQAAMALTWSPVAVHDRMSVEDIASAILAAYDQHGATRIEHAAACTAGHAGQWAATREERHAAARLWSNPARRRRCRLLAARLELATRSLNRRDRTPIVHDQPGS